MIFVFVGYQVFQYFLGNVNYKKKTAIEEWWFGYKNLYTQESHTFVCMYG